MNKTFTSDERAAARLPWIALAVAFIAQLGISMANQVVAPLAPLIQSELGVNKTEIGLFASATYGGSCAALILFGLLTDRFGARRVMVLGQVGVALSLASMGMVVSLLQGTVVMFVAGSATAGIYPGTAKAVVDWFSPRLRATAMGIKQAAVPVAGILTASVLPSLAILIGWRLAIAALGATLLLAAILTQVWYPEHPSYRSNAGSQRHLAAGFRDLLHNRALWLLALVSTLFAMAQMAVTTYLALYLSDELLVQDFPTLSTRAVVAGAFLALWQLGGVVGRICWGALSDRRLAGRRMWAMLVIGLFSSAVFGLFSLSDPSWPLWLIAIVVLIGGGTALGWTGLYVAAAAEISGPDHAATGVALTMIPVQIGNVVGPLLFGMVVDNSHSFSIGWLTVSGLFVLGCGIGVSALNGERVRRTARTK